MPTGFALCPTCPAFEITTTAEYEPPVKVCIEAPDSISVEEFLRLRLMHGENDIFVDRTTEYISIPGVARIVCGEVDSLSPFALASVLGPTAARVSVSGRVETSNGRGIMNAQLTLTGNDGPVRTARSNAFGYFRFDGVQAGETYVISVRAKGMQFETQVISVFDEITDLVFTALPEGKAPEDHLR
jgi:hypothetical protein